MAQDTPTPDAAAAERRETRPASQKRLTGAALALLAVLFVAVNVIVSFAVPAERIDLTEEELYTLAPATERIVSRIEEPITLKFYYSSRLGAQIPSFDVYADRVLDLLREYRDLADGRIALEIYDPEPFTVMEDRAVSFGLQAVPLEGVEGNVFFGLVGTNLTDDVEVIPFFQAEREGLLEYDLSQMIHQLSEPVEPKIGLMSTLSIDTQVRMGQSGRPENTRPKVIVQSLRDVFRVEDVDVEVQKIPDDIELLMIVHPRMMPEHALFAIDQYILGGGKAILFLDPLSEMQTLEVGANIDGTSNSEFERLLGTWGVRMPTDTVVADRFAARRIGSSSGQGFVTYLPWLLLRGPNLDADSPLTSQLDSLAVAPAGRIELTEDSPLSLEPLIVSSPGSSLISVDEIDARRPRPEALLAGYQPGSERYVIAGLLRGEVQTAFPDGRPPLEEGLRPDPDAVFETVRIRSDGPIEVLAVADADLLDDRFWVQVREFYGRPVSVPTAGNGAFVVNAADALTGNSDLLALRGEGTSYRPFEVIERIKREADRRFQSKEQELRRTLTETERKLAQLRERADAGASAALNEEERDQVRQYQRQILQLRTELRDVQRSLREDVERLETQVLFANIVAMPLIVALVAVLIAAWRAVRRRRRAVAADG